MKLTRKGFRAWLAGKRPSTVVGRALTYDCPLSRYVNRPINPYTDRFPQWVHRFVSRADKAGLGQSITARRALEILDGKP